MLSATEITAKLGGREVLHRLDVAARPGQITAIVGPNGSGKTTLLRRLTGDLPGGGVVLLEGEPVAQVWACCHGPRWTLPSLVRWKRLS